jgi:cephalosporin hydroxylase
MNSRRGLTELLDRQGSDKGKWYGGLYDVLLYPSRETIRCVIEIGIGTMIPAAPSSMVGWGAENYRPGGSLRAWRDFLPAAEIHGVDVAPDTQFSDEPRIHTHLCDSRNAAEIAALFARIAPVRPDLIIDDGLHEAAAQLQTLRNFFPYLCAGGLYVIEDVLPEEVLMVTAELSSIVGGSPFFVDNRAEPWAAIVIRKIAASG